MATLDDVAPEHRSVASRIKHLDKLPAEEARHRAAHVYRLEKNSPLTGEGQRLTLAHTSRILSSPPVGEYLAQLKHYNDLANQMGNGDGDILSNPAHQMRNAAADLKAKCQFPPGLVEACEQRLLGKNPAGWDECDLDAVLGIGQAEKSKAEAPERKARLGEGFCQFCGQVVKGTDYVKGSAHWGGKCISSRGNRGEVEKSIKAAEKALDKRANDLRKEIDAYKTKIATAYATAGRPIPASLGLKPAQHPDMPRIRELESEATRLREKASGVSEPDLSEHYLSKARELDERAAQLKRAEEATV